MINILITGGLGFLGQYVTKYLSERYRHINITILDLKENPHPVFDLKKIPNTKIITGANICDIDSIDKYFNKIDVVIHLAGIVSFSLKDKDALMNVNVNGTKNIVSLVNKHDIPILIHVSSVAALGFNNDKNAPINENYKFDWDYAKKRKKFYMLSKYYADLELEKIESARTVVLYPGLLFGPGDFANSSKLINSISTGKLKFNMPGGTNVIDVRDVAKGIVKTINYPSVSGQYILSGHNLNFKQINNVIAEELNVKKIKTTIPRRMHIPIYYSLYIAELLFGKKVPVFSDNVDSSFLFRYFDNSKAHEEFDWKPNIKLNKCIKDSIDWLKENDIFEE